MVVLSTACAIAVNHTFNLMRIGFLWIFFSFWVDLNKKIITDECQWLSFAFSQILKIIINSFFLLLSLKEYYYCTMRGWNTTYYPLRPTHIPKSGRPEVGCELVEME